MKKLLLFFALFILTMLSQAQELNLLETLKQINNKIQCCQVYTKQKNDTVSYSKNAGLVIWKEGKEEPAVSLFHLQDTKGYKFPFAELQIEAEDKGIIIMFDKILKDYTVSLLRGEGKVGTLIGVFANKKDAETVFKALVHLRLIGS